MVLLNIEIAKLVYPPRIGQQQMPMPYLLVFSSNALQHNMGWKCNCAPKYGQQNGGKAVAFAVCELRGRAERPDITFPRVCGSGWAAPDLLRYPVAQDGFGLVPPPLRHPWHRAARQDRAICEPNARMDCD